MTDNDSEMKASISSHCEVKYRNITLRIRFMFTSKLMLNIKANKYINLLKENSSSKYSSLLNLTRQDFWKKTCIQVCVAWEKRKENPRHQLYTTWKLLVFSHVILEKNSNILKWCTRITYYYRAFLYFCGNHDTLQF